MTGMHLHVYFKDIYIISKGYHSSSNTFLILTLIFFFNGPYITKQTLPLRKIGSQKPSATRFPRKTPWKQCKGRFWWLFLWSEWSPFLSQSSYFLGFGAFFFHLWFLFLSAKDLFIQLWRWGSNVFPLSSLSKMNPHGLDYRTFPFIKNDHMS